jgi:tetratricopeptide (TPR) repeat protein
MSRLYSSVVLLLALSSSARAGLYYSGEPIAELPSQWRGFLLDHRALRTAAVPPSATVLPHPFRDTYREAAAKLTQTAAQRPLTAEEAADLGALHLRLGAIDAALAVLRAAHRDHPDHFRAAANLGTAYQLRGDLDQAILALQSAVRLAPAKWKKAEELHLRLVRLRRGEPRDAQGLDDLFGVRLDAADKKVPADADALTQQLALWLPADGRLLWQLGELAHATGDVRTASSILDGCVTEFAMGHPDLRRHRHEYRAAADALAKQDPVARPSHEQHQTAVTFRSPRPLVRRYDSAKLPPVRPEGLNELPWPLLVETVVTENKPRFPAHLQKLDGLKVVLTGFMQPLGDEIDLGAFLLIEYPVGCWFCEVPEPNAMMFVEMPAGKTFRLTRNLVRIEGRLMLNSTDPENFLYTIRDAKVGPPD